MRYLISVGNVKVAPLLPTIICAKRRGNGSSGGFGEGSLRENAAGSAEAFREGPDEEESRRDRAEVLQELRP
jgi:hypothetical protein